MNNETKEKIIARVIEQWQGLGENDKRLIRFYLQFPLETLLTKIEQFGLLASRQKNNARAKEFLNQVELYQIAYLLKVHTIPVKGGAKTRRIKKRRGLKQRTRRR